MLLKQFKARACRTAALLTGSVSFCTLLQFEWRKVITLSVIQPDSKTGWLWQANSIKRCSFQKKVPDHQNVHQKTCLDWGSDRNLNLVVVNILINDYKPRKCPQWASQMLPSCGVKYTQLQQTAPTNLIYGTYMDDEYENSRISCNFIVYISLSGLVVITWGHRISPCCHFAFSQAAWVEKWNLEQFVIKHPMQPLLRNFRCSLVQWGHSAAVNVVTNHKPSKSDFGRKETPLCCWFEKLVKFWQVSLNQTMESERRTRAVSNRNHETMCCESAWSAGTSVFR